VDALREELEVFADAIEGYRAFPVSAEDMLATVAAFEAAVKALEIRDSVQVVPV
jgi:predicted dehydrogenase